DDIEYKGDEAYSMYYARAVGRSEPWPAVGMPSSAGTPNFGLSVWVFVGLARLSAAETPPELARAVALCSILALALYLPVIRRLVRRREREAWAWGVALMALSPLTVLLHRKIWPPSLFPLFTLAALAGWLRRDRAAGAFVFGLAGALLGQVQMGGFFLAAAFALWAGCFDRASVRWRWWFLRSAAVALPMLPWLVRFWQDPAVFAPTEEGSWEHPLTGLFWLRWLVQAYGFDTLNYPLGGEFWAFLRHPLIAGRPTYLVAALHGLSAA